MTHYIQKLHDENKEEDLVDFMQQSFPNFDVTYKYSTEHAGYFTFKHNGKVAIEFIIVNFKTYHFGVNDFRLEKNGFHKQVNKAYLTFMKETFEQFAEDYDSYLNKENNTNLLI